MLDRRTLLAAAPLIAAAPGLAAGAAPAIGRPGSRVEMGIRFRKEADGSIRGRERVSYTFSADGSVTMSARSESFDPPVVRDVIYLLGPDFRPRSVSVQISSGGKPVGSGWYRLTAESVELEGETTPGGRVSERHELSVPVAALVAHPVSTDVLVSMAADRSKPGTVVPASGVHLTSADPYGRTGPAFVTADIALTYVGRETLATPLGDMAADHVLLHLRNAQGRFEPFQDLWCAAGTPVFLQAYARPPVATRYEIEDLAII